MQVVEIWQPEYSSQGKLFLRTFIFQKRIRSFHTSKIETTLATHDCIRLYAEMVKSSPLPPCCSF